MEQGIGGYGADAPNPRSFAPLPHVHERTDAYGGDGDHGDDHADDQSHVRSFSAFARPFI